jgi:copper(I)-binding protein
MAALAAGVGAALGLTGCSAGQITQTSTQVAPVPGANVDAGELALRNVLIQYRPEGYPAGGDAPLVVRIFNNGMEPVTLTGVSTDQAASVNLVGTPEVVTPTGTATLPPEIASPSPAASPTETSSPSPDESPTASPSPTESPSPTPAPTTPPAQPISITIPGQSFVLLVPGEGDTGHLVLTGLTEAIVPGGVVTLTFTFDDGTEVVVPVPLAPPIDEVPRATPVVEPGGHAG